MQTRLLAVGERDDMKDILKNNILEEREQLLRRIAELEKLVEERTAQYEAANKELEVFSYSISHDLRAPLHTIAGFSQILKEEFSGQLSDEALHYIERLQKGVRQMDSLIKDLLAFSKTGRQELHRLTVQPLALVNEVLEELPEEVKERTITFTLGKLPACNADPHLLKQVFANLLSNAVKFTRNRVPAVIEINAQSSDGQTVYFVRDNGVGFNMEYAGRLFGVFQRLHREEEYEGTGVGLAIARRIIHRHGGRIWADADKDKGATFSFTLGSA